MVISMKAAAAALVAAGAAALPALSCDRWSRLTYMHTKVHCDPGPLHASCTAPSCSARWCWVGGRCRPPLRCNTCKLGMQTRPWPPRALQACSQGCMSAHARGLRRGSSTAGSARGPVHLLQHPRQCHLACQRWPGVVPAHKPQYVARPGSRAARLRQQQAHRSGGSPAGGLPGRPAAEQRRPPGLCGGQQQPGRAAQQQRGGQGEDCPDGGDCVCPRLRPPLLPLTPASHARLLAPQAAAAEAATGLRK